MSNDTDSTRRFPVHRVTGDRARSDDDQLAVEEPMEIRLTHGAGSARKALSLSVTMRTPGSDFELAAGFLFTENLLSDPRQIEAIEFCGPAAPGRSRSNIVRVDLDPDVAIDVGRLQRNFYTTSSCGICGKASLEALQIEGIRPLDPDRFIVRGETIRALPAALRAGQPLFDRTGGLHAAGLFDATGRLHSVREDVGRHNAVDKLFGRAFLDGETPLADRGLVVSGRASFELLQKALVAGAAMLIAVGAPSSLAVELATRFGMTLVGFASAERFNVYAGKNRIL